MDESSRQSSPRGAERSTRWLAVLAGVLGVTVVVLIIVLVQRNSAPKRAAAAPLADKKVDKPAVDPPKTGTIQVPVPDAKDLSKSAKKKDPGRKPYVAVVPKTPGAGGGGGPGSPTPGGPGGGPGGGALSQMLKGFGSLLGGPDVQKSLNKMMKSLQNSAKGLGKLFQGFLGGGTGSGKGAGKGAADPFDKLLNKAFGGLGLGEDRITATLRDGGDAYEVRCRFGGKKPERTTFKLRGNTLVIKARFSDDDSEEKEIRVPGAFDATRVRSRVEGGELVITLPKER